MERESHWSQAPDEEQVSRRNSRALFGHVEAGLQLSCTRIKKIYERIDFKIYYKIYRSK